MADLVVEIRENIGNAHRPTSSLFWHDFIFYSSLLEILRN